MVGGYWWWPQRGNVDRFKNLKEKKNQEDLAIAWMGLGKEKGIGAKDNSVALNPDLY